MCFVIRDNNREYIFVVCLEKLDGNYILGDLLVVYNSGFIPKWLLVVYLVLENR